MTVRLNSVEFVLNEGWRDASKVAEITEDLLEGYGTRVAITNLMNQFLAAPLTPEEQGQRLVWVDSTRQVVDLTLNAEISCFSYLIHKIKMLFSSNYAASIEKAAADIVQIYTTYYNQACDDRREQMFRLQEHHAYFSGGAAAKEAELKTQADKVMQDWMDQALKQGSLREAYNNLAGYFGFDPSAQQQLAIDKFIQLSGCSNEEVKDRFKRKELLEQGEEKFKALELAYQQADKAYQQQKAKAEQVKIDKDTEIPKIQAEMDRLSQLAAVVGFHF